MLKPRVDILLEEYERLKECERENQRLNNDIKILLKENEAKEKVIIKHDNVLNELEKWLSKVYMSGYYEELYKIGIKDSYDKLQELKESDK